MGVGVRCLLVCMFTFCNAASGQTSVRHLCTDVFVSQPQVRVNSASAVLAL